MSYPWGKSAHLSSFSVKTYLHIMRVNAAWASVRHLRGQYSFDSNVYKETRGFEPKNIVKKSVFNATLTRARK